MNHKPTDPRRTRLLPSLSRLARKMQAHDDARNLSLLKKTAALLRAADYLNTLQWIGDSVDAMRLMAWPRQGDGLTPGLVPPQVKAACIELAGLIYGGRDVLAPLARGGMILAESHSLKAGDVDVIGGDSTSDSYTYAEAAPVEDYLPSVVGILRPLLREIPGKPAGIFLAGIVRG